MPTRLAEGTVSLRRTTITDAVAFFRFESDPEARHMAAFGGEDPVSQATYQVRWHRMLSDEAVVSRTVLWNGQIVGSVLQFELFQKPSIAYWIGREFWNKGIATRAVSMFLCESPTRPLYARVAKDNLASRKVLENCGFRIVGENKGFARFRGAEVEELIYQLGES